MSLDLLLIVININIITFNYGISKVNNSSKNKEFCLYPKNSVMKIVNSFSSISLKKKLNILVIFCSLYIG